MYGDCQAVDNLGQGSILAELVFQKVVYLVNRMLLRHACPSLNLPPPLPEDVDLGLIDPMSTVAISEDSNSNLDASEEVQCCPLISSLNNLTSPK